MILAAKKRSAFSLIELVIVVVIIGIIAAIAIPRMSRGAVGANESSLTGNLAVLRKAIDLYATEHDGAFPSGTDATFIAQLTTYTDSTGATSATKTGAFIYGPYLRSIPACPVGSCKGKSAIISTGSAGADVTKGWLYNATSGTIVANCPDTDVDSASKKYNAY